MNRTLAALLVTLAVIAGCSTGPDIASPAAASPSVASAPTPALTPEPTTEPSARPKFDQGESDLQPGTYTAQLPVGYTMSLTFIVPAGWYAYADPPGVLRGLGPTGEPGTGSPGGIAFQFRDVTTLKGDPCHWSGTDDDIPVGPTADDLVRALQEQTAYEASDPVDVVVGGYAGRRVDIVSPAEAFAEVNGATTAVGCDQDVWRFWDGEIYAQGPANRWQTNILDVDGTRLVIVVQDFPGTSAADRAELDAIVDSFEITP